MDLLANNFVVVMNRENVEIFEVVYQSFTQYSIVVYTLIQLAILMIAFKCYIVDYHPLASLGGNYFNLRLS